MKNILDEIVAYKKQEVQICMREMPATVLMKSPQMDRTVNSLKAGLQKPGATGIIAEFKRQSPSKGIINDKVSVEEVTAAYAAAGASCLSVLTDQHFFGGTLDDLRVARSVHLPILRKDFMIDEYQILEARAAGADVILLIAACLTPTRVQELAKYARKLSLEVLLEIHGEEELDRICAEVDLVGVNNRNLKTFKVDIDNSIRLRSLLPKDKLAIAESGIDSVDIVDKLRGAGFSGFLIGEHFMKQADPGKAFATYVQSLQGLKNQ